MSSRICQLHMMWFKWVGKSLCHKFVFLEFASEPLQLFWVSWGRFGFSGQLRFSWWFLIPAPQQVIAPWTVPWGTWRQYTSRIIWGHMTSIIICYRARSFSKVATSFLLEWLYICMDEKFSHKSHINGVVLFNVKEDLWLSISSAK